MQRFIDFALVVVSITCFACAEARRPDDGTGSAAGEAGAPDAAPATPDPCECETGECCDGCQFLPASQPCSAALATEYQCSAQACGADAQSRDQFQFCTGDSAMCGTQNVQWSDWQVIADCGIDAVCESDGLSANCTTCAEGCVDGQCTCTQGANVAPSATASFNSGSTSSLYGAYQMNDGTPESGCGFAWFRDRDPDIGWIELQWSTEQELWGFTIDTVSASNAPCMYTGNRTLGSGTIQWWNGSAWVNDGTASGQTDDWTYRFTAPVVTTRIRIYQAMGVPQANPVVFEWQAFTCN